MPTVPPGEGGGGATAARIIFQHEGEQLRGGTQIQEVVEVGAESIPSAVFFQFRLGATGYTRAAGQAYADGFGLLIEGLLALPVVAAVSYVQDVDAAGQLLDQLEVFWQTEDGSAQGSIVTLMSSATQDTVTAQINAAMAPYL